MRHVTKGLLGAAAFFVAAGLILALAGWAMGADTNLDVNLDGHRVRIGPHGINGWNDWEYTGAAGEEHTGGARELGGFRNIDIAATIADISFETAQDYGVELRWYDERLEMDYQVEGDTLSIWNTRQSFNSMNSPKTGRVVVYLPENAGLDSVSIQVDMGDIHMEDRMVDSLFINSDMGRAQLSGITARSLDMYCDMGGLSALDCTVTDSLTASNSMGEIEISGDIRGTVDLEDDMGSITLRTAAPVSDFGYDLEVDMGKLTVNGRTYTGHTEREGGPHSLYARNSMGNIDLSFSNTHI